MAVRLVLWAGPLEARVQTLGRGSQTLPWGGWEDNAERMSQSFSSRMGKLRPENRAGPGWRLLSKCLASEVT